MHLPSIGEFLANITGHQGPLVNNVSFEFEISAHQADELISAYMETRQEEPDEVFTVFHALILYIKAVSEAALANLESHGETGLTIDDTLFVFRMKGVLDALHALRYEGKEYNEKVNASIGPKVNEPGVAIVRISL